MANARIGCARAEWQQQFLPGQSDVCRCSAAAPPLTERGAGQPRSAATWATALDASAPRS